MRALIFLLLFAPVLSHANEIIRQYFETLNGGYNIPVHGTHLVNTNELERIYHDRNHQPLWYKNGKPIRETRQLYLAVETSTTDGLLPEDYHNRALQQQCPAEKGEGLAHCDLLFTDAFLLLAQHLLAGKVNAETMQPGWEPEERRRNLVALLRKALAESRITEVLASLRPEPLEYQRLTAALKRLRAATRYPEWSTLPTTPSIEPGQEDERLSAIVDRLVFWGDMEATSTPITHYDDAMRQAIQYFQERHGMVPNGVIDEATLTALNVEPTKRAQQIMANLERWRWLDETLGARYLSVDLAELRLRAHQHGETEFTLPVAVSEHHRDVPVFSSMLRYVVLNPEWVVPEERALQEYLPQLKRDPSQLQEAGFTLFVDDERVDPSSVDWSEVSEDSFRLVQEPGPNNALGQMQFALPNPYQVYLHAAPEQDVLQEGADGFSAGSIRVEEPLKLASWLLQNRVWSDDQLIELLETGLRETIYMTEPLPFHLVYRTAWVNNQGVLNFRADVLERDKPVYEALTQPVRAAQQATEGQ